MALYAAAGRARALDQLIQTLQAIPGAQAARALGPALSALTAARRLGNPAALRAATGQLTAAIAAPGAPRAALSEALATLTAMRRAMSGLTVAGPDPALITPATARLAAPPLRGPEALSADVEQIGLSPRVEGGSRIPTPSAPTARPGALVSGVEQLSPTTRRAMAQVVGEGGVVGDGVERTVLAARAAVNEPALPRRGAEALGEDAPQVGVVAQTGAPRRGDEAVSEDGQQVSAATQAAARLRGSEVLGEDGERVGVVAQTGDLRRGSEALGEDGERVGLTTQRDGSTRGAEAVSEDGVQPGATPQATARLRGPGALGDVVTEPGFLSQVPPGDTTTRRLTAPPLRAPEALSADVELVGLTTRGARATPGAEGLGEGAAPNAPAGQSAARLRAAEGRSDDVARPGPAAQNVQSQGAEARSADVARPGASAQDVQSQGSEARSAEPARPGAAAQNVQPARAPEARRDDDERVSLTTQRDRQAPGTEARSDDAALPGLTTQRDRQASGTEAQTDDVERVSLTTQRDRQASGTEARSDDDAQPGLTTQPQPGDPTSRRLTAPPLRAPEALSAEVELVGLRRPAESAPSLSTQTPATDSSQGRLTAPPLRSPEALSAEVELVGLRRPVERAPSLSTQTPATDSSQGRLMAPPLRSPEGLSADADRRRPVDSAPSLSTQTPATDTSQGRLTAPPLRSPEGLSADRDLRRPVESAPGPTLQSTRSGRLTAPPLRTPEALSADRDLRRPVESAPGLTVQSTRSGRLTAPPPRTPDAMSADAYLRRPVESAPGLTLQSTRSGRLTAPPLRSPEALSAEVELVGLRAQTSDAPGLPTQTPPPQPSGAPASPDRLLRLLAEQRPRDRRAGRLGVGASSALHALPLIDAAIRAVAALEADPSTSPALRSARATLGDARRALLSADPDAARRPLDRALRTLSGARLSGDQAPLHALRSLLGQASALTHPAQSRRGLTPRRLDTLSSILAREAQVEGRTSLLGRGPLGSASAAEPRGRTLRAARGLNRLLAPRPSPTLDLDGVIVELRGVLARGGPDAASLAPALESLTQAQRSPSVELAGLTAPLIGALRQLQASGAAPLDLNPLLRRLGQLPEGRRNTGVVSALREPQRGAMTLLKAPAWASARRKASAAHNQTVDTSPPGPARAGLSAPVQRRASGNVALGGVSPVVLAPPKPAAARPAAPAAPAAPSTDAPPMRWSAPAAAMPTPPSWSAAADPRARHDAEPSAAPDLTADPPAAALPSTEAELLLTLRALARGSAEARGLLREIGRAIDEQSRFNQWRRL